MNKQGIKQILGEIPLTAEIYWRLRQRGDSSTVGFNLSRLEESLPEWVAMTKDSPFRNQEGKRLMIFGMIHYWIEHTTLIGLALAGLGHRVHLVYLPYAKWKEPINRFDLRRQNAYLRELLSPTIEMLNIYSLLDSPNYHKASRKPIPPFLKESMEAQAYRDTQYSLLIEEVEQDSDLYYLRKERNIQAASALLAWIENNRPEVVIVPNGSILEFGVVYQVAQYLDIPTVTYEFGEQNHRIWLAQNADVMAQETTGLWASRGDIPLTEDEWGRIRIMFESRQGARVWETFARQWQGIPSKGGEQVRADLGLDGRPLAFLPTNVLGDSLTLGRQIFSEMTNWLRRTIRHFSEHPDFQLVIRVHPGEQIGWGPSVFDILTASFPNLPENVHLLPSNARVNSYDLVEAADLGLVYTTTMGLEMAMSGLPVIVTGNTHYRGKGFTLDPNSWDEFDELLAEALQNPERLKPTREKVQLAWRYAYRFFFEYPQPFPWHLHYYWEELDKMSLSYVLSENGQAKYGKTFRYLTGEPIEYQSHEDGY